MDSVQCWLCALSSLVLSVSSLGPGEGVRVGKGLRERGRLFSFHWLARCGKLGGLQGTWQPLTQVEPGPQDHLESPRDA